MTEQATAIDTAEEEPIRPRKRAPEETDIDITPMIDVTFLLLIFFLVTNRAGDNSGVKYPYALHGAGVPSRTSLVITFVPGGEGEAQVFLGDGRKDLLTGSLKEQEEKIVTYVQEGLKASPRKENIILKADKAVRHRDVARVAQAIAKAGQVQIYAAVLEQE